MNVKSKEQVRENVEKMSKEQLIELICQLSDVVRERERYIKYLREYIDNRI